MKKFITLLCLIVPIGKSSLISLTTAVEPTEECKDFAGKSPAVRLKDYLFCKYPWNENDTKTNSTVVGIRIFTIFATMNEYENQLKLSNWIHLTWIDENLTWDPAQFDNVRTLPVHPSDIWKPAISIQNLDSEQADEDVLILGRCQAHYKGEIFCSTRHRNTISCKNDFTLWPYDRHNCTLAFTSWAQMRNQIMFEPMDILNPTVFTYGFMANGHWEISVSRVSYEQIRSKHVPMLKISKLSVDFIVDRVHSHLAGRYIMPGILITVMTLATVSLHPGSKERLALGCLNPIIHLLSIEDLHCILSMSPNTVPNIVLIYMNSFGLAIVALLLTVFLAKLSESKSSVPRWISSTILFVLKYRIVRIVMLGMRDRRARSSIEECDADRESGNFNDFEHEKISWNYVVLLFNWITFLSIFFTYAVLWTILVPNSSMKTPIVDVSEQFFNDE